MELDNPKVNYRHSLISIVSFILILYILDTIIVNGNNVL